MFEIILTMLQNKEEGEAPLIILLIKSSLSFPHNIQYDDNSYKTKTLTN